MSLTIRPAMPSDLEALQALDPGRAELFGDWTDAGHVHVAIEGTGAVGYAVMTTHFFDRAFVELLMVAERVRRRGIATAILRYLEANSPTAELWTSTNESNGPMRALLAAESFVASGTIDGLDEGDPELIFRKRVRAD